MVLVRYLKKLIGPVRTIPIPTVDIIKRVNGVYSDTAHIIRH